MNIIITGSGGFIGGHLFNRLRQDGHTIFELTSDLRAPEYYFCTFHQDELPQIDVLYHVAANNDTLDQDEYEMFNVNYFGGINIFNLALEKGCKNFVFSSSTAVYGDAKAPYSENHTFPQPLNPYARSKLAFDYFAMDFAKKNGVKVVGLRYCNVYGPNEYLKGKRASMICQLTRQMMAGNQPTIFSNGEQKRDYIYVKDVVEMNIRASEYTDSDIFNCGYGKATTFNEIIRLINKQMGTNFEPNYIANPYTDSYQDYTECNMEKSRSLLNFSPKYDIESGIADYAPYIIHNEKLV